MTNEQANVEDGAIASGARHVEETEHLEAGLDMPGDVAAEEREPEKGNDDEPVKTNLGELTLSMFQQGAGTRVRVGNANNPSEMYEAVFDSPDAANNALLDAGVLTERQVGDVNALAGTGIKLGGVSVEELEAAGLKRHGTSTL